jgi:tRNA dimethylallyltransferase
MNPRTKIILVAGPTASGKSNFAIKIAKKIKGEIINADSMQVYKELKILTARPKKKDQKKIKHHLYGVQNSSKKFSTGDWLKLACKKIQEIKKKGKTPILVGGTGLYFKSLIDGLVKIPKISSKKRNNIRSLHRKLGQKKFYKKLLQIDPLAKNIINQHDAQRSIRAFEIKKYTRKSMLHWFRDTKVLFDPNDFIKIYIDFPRQELLKKIEERIGQMLEDGAIEEVRKFDRLKVRKENTANKVIGIKEIRNYLNGELGLEETRERIFIKTRQYAKRQTTWARGQMISWQKVNPSDLNLLVKKFK